MISVVCWLWKDPKFRFRDSFSYCPEHVNRLQRMVSRNLSMPHRFICMTDYPQEAFHPSVWAKPMWQDLREYGGCYTRLRAFSPDAAHILGPRFVSIDVDCVITGSLDPLFDREEDFVIWKDVDPRQPICGSMWMMTAGSRAHVWESFDINAAHRLRKENRFIGTDQAWMATMLRPEEYALWKKADGVYSASDRELRAPKINRHGFQSKLPDDARVVFFHGRRDPSMVRMQEDHPWITEHYGEPFETRSCDV